MSKSIQDLVDELEAAKAAGEDTTEIKQKIANLRNGGAVVETADEAPAKKRTRSAKSED